MDDRNICCLCAKQGDEYRNILNMTQTGIIKILKKLFHIVFNTETKYHYICIRCDKKLADLDEFRKEIEQAQKYLKSLDQALAVSEEELITVPIDVKVEAIELPEFQIKDEPLDGDEKHTVLDSISQTLFDDQVSSDNEKQKSRLRLNKYEEQTESGKKSILKAVDRDKKINESFDFTCPRCSIQLNDWQKYRQHLEHNHNDTLSLIIACCGLDLRLNRKVLLDHVEYHTDPDKFKCKLCGKQFTTAANMKKHEWRHKNSVKKSGLKSKAQKVPCEQCGRVLADRDSHKKHMALHMSEEEREKLKAQCDYCQKVFRDKNTVLSHIKNTHVLSGQTFSCDQCAKVYPTRKAFSDHYKIHHSNKRVTCSECGMEMKACNLGKHRRLKHDHEPKTCPICFKVIKNRATLMIHRIRYHMGPRFSCEVCGKMFNVKQKCKEHQEAHFNPNRFSCDQCEYMNNDYANMLKHRKTRHPNATPLVHGTGRQILEIR